MHAAVQSSNSRSNLEFHREHKKGVVYTRLLLTKRKTGCAQKLPVIVTNQCSLESVVLPRLVDTSTHDVVKKKSQFGISYDYPGTCGVEYETPMISLIKSNKQHKCQIYENNGSALLYEESLFCKK